MNKPIVVTWGLGPSYRERVKHNFLKSLETGYNNTMDYLILTDVPEDFDELRASTNKIIDVINIHEVREQYPWSKEIEFIPTNQEKYGEEYIKNYSTGKQFSYSLNRFSLPRIAELGYTKFVMHDPDSDIRYDKIVSGEITEEEFWNQFDTPVNSMKGCHMEYVGIDPGDVFLSSAAIGPNSKGTLQMSSILVDRLNQKFNNNKNAIIEKLYITEGPFRYYNFESPEKVKEYFNIWNESINISFSDLQFKRCSECGGYMLCDYIPVGVSNYYCNIEVLHFDPLYYNVNIYFTDRYFMPKVINFDDGTHLTSASTLEEFYQINTKQIEILKQQNQWPVF
jgi:hypothetical protein